MKLLSKGKYFRDKVTLADLEKSTGFLMREIELDPAFSALASRISIWKSLAGGLLMRYFQSETIIRSDVFRRGAAWRPWARLGVKDRQAARTNRSQCPGEGLAEVARRSLRG